MADAEIRERAEHLITLAVAAFQAVIARRTISQDDIAFLITEAPWVARQLLEALNRIEQLETIHAETVLESARAEAVGQSKRVQAAKRLHHPSALEQHVCGECAHLWPCPTWLALNPKEADDA